MTTFQHMYTLSGDIPHYGISHHVCMFRGLMPLAETTITLLAMGRNVLRAGNYSRNLVPWPEACVLQGHKPRVRHALSFEVRHALSFEVRHALSFEDGRVCVECVISYTVLGQLWWLVLVEGLGLAGVCLWFGGTDGQLAGGLASFGTCYVKCKE